MPTTWSIWCDSTGTSTSGTCDAWYAWNDCTTTTTNYIVSTCTDTTWIAWTSNSIDNVTPAPQRSQESIERERVAVHENEERNANAERTKKDLIAARKRAMKLLLTNLTKKQKEQFAKHKFFIVKGGKSKRKYRIRSNADKISLPMANIDVLHHDNDNNVDHRICFHLSYGIPLGDQLLAQKLMLENDEDRALKVSNRHAA